MKKLIVLALLVVGITAYAQEENVASRRAEFEKMTPQQKTEMALKRLTSELGLNEKQQKEIGKIMGERNALRAKNMAERKVMKETGAKPTPEERMAKKTRREDEEKEFQSKMEKVLTTDQIKKWDNMKKVRKAKMEDRKEDRKEQRKEK